LLEAAAYVIEHPGHLLLLAVALFTSDVGSTALNSAGRPGLRQSVIIMVDLAASVAEATAERDERIIALAGMRSHPDASDHQVCRGRPWLAVAGL